MKCKVCRKEIKQKKGPGRPRTTHKACKGGSVSKTKKIKSGSVRRHRTGTVTRSRKGTAYAGSGTGWIVLHHEGRTGDTQHDKIWSVKVAKKGKGWTVITRHGRRGGQMNESARKQMSYAAADRLMSSLINSKCRKGYYLKGVKRRRRLRRRI